MRIPNLTAAATATTAAVLATLALSACGPDDAPLRSSGTPGPSASSSAQDDADGPGDAHGEPGSGSAAGDVQGEPAPGKSANGGDSDASNGGGPRRACTTADTSVRATTVPRPLNTLLITVTNNGGKICDLRNHPYLKFTGAQAVPPPIESSKPQAVVTLAPGEKGYAAVRLSAADGSGSHGYRATTLDIGLTKNDITPVALPSDGVHVDDSLTVTYWQGTAEDALMH